MQPRERRSNVFMTATLEGEGLPIDVRLRNMSSKGALVEAMVLPKPDTEVMFRKGELMVRGKVIWCQGKQAGVAFEREREPAQVMRHIPAPKPLREFASKRPPVKGGRISAGEWKIAEDYIFGDPIPGIDE